jgi:hypothetical protein
MKKTENLANLTEGEKQELFALIYLELKRMGLFDRLLNYGIKLYRQKTDTVAAMSPMIRPAGSPALQRSRPAPDTGIS